MVTAVARPLSLSYRRPADRSEKAALETAYQAVGHSPAADAAEMLTYGALGLVALLFAGPFLFILLWIVDAATGVRLGSGEAWMTAAALWLGGSLGFGAVRVSGRRRRDAALRRALADDIEGGDVVEESWRFVAAIGFQEAEKLPLLYVLRADDGRAVALEEKRLIGDQAPQGSSAPSDAVFVRGPKSRRLLSESYSGPSLSLNAILPLVDFGDARPDHGDVLDRPWPAIAAQLSGRPDVGFRSQS